MTLGDLLKNKIATYALIGTTAFGLTGCLEQAPKYNSNKATLNLPKTEDVVIISDLNGDKSADCITRRHGVTKRTSLLYKSPDYEDKCPGNGEGKEMDGAIQAQANEYLRESNDMIETLRNGEEVPYKEGMLR